MLLLVGAVFAAGALSLSCVEDHPRDQYFGTDAGSNFKPGEFDAPIDSSATPDATVDGGVDGDVDGASPDAL